jgi:hypothetical protein
MDETAHGPEEDRSELDSLEGSSTVVEQDSAAAPAVESDSVKPAPELATPPGSGGGANAPAPKPPKLPLPARLQVLFRRFNIYLLLFAFVIVAAVVILAIALVHSHTTSGTIAGQTLDQSTLDQLANTDATVGDSKQVLNVQSSAIFAGQVLVRSNLEVAGTIQVGGSLALSGITVTGNSAFDQVQVNKDLTVAGTTALQGSLTVQKSLNVNGGGTFSGPVSATQLTATSLQLNGDFTLTPHITFGGAIPSRTNGSALGSGGTASVSGSDSAGSITINTGNSPSAGCFVTINFTQKFNATPHVIVTPVGSSAGGLGYYVNRSTSNFSVCTTTAAAGGQTFGFDYLVLD